MVNTFKALFQPLRKHRWIDEAIRRSMEVLRQWPFILPRGVVTCATDWIKHEQKSSSWFGRRLTSWYREIHPEEIHVLPRWPSERGEKEVEFHTSRVWYAPACGLYYLDGAYVLSPHGAVLSRRRELFDEFSHVWNGDVVRGNGYFDPFATFSLRPVRLQHLAATIAVIGAENYYHWMFNVMPRIHLLESVLGIVDFFITPPLRSSFQKECLKTVGLAEDRTLPLDQKTCYLCERIFVPSVGPHDGAVPRWSVDYLRRLFLPLDSPIPSTRRRLYLSRGDVHKRSVVNEAEVRRVMIDHGFEVIVPHEMTVREQAALYAQASHLVGPHGAAFTNMVFSTDALVAEIFSPDYLAVGCFQALAAMCGHRYEYFLGERVPAREGGATATTVDLDRLAEWIGGWLDRSKNPSS